MTALKIGIVEDELLIADSIALALESLGYEVTDSAGSYEEAITMLDNERPDLVLLDINLKGEQDGIDLALKIKDKYGLPFIFLTANADSLTVNRAKDAHPSSYLLKPFQKEDLFTAIEIAIANHTKSRDTAGGNGLIEMPEALFIKDSYYFHKVLFEDIIYLESDDVYVNVVTKDQKKFLVRTSLKQYYTDHFDSKVFFRVSRSHVINLKHLDGINSAYVKVKGQQIAIGKNYRDELLAGLGLSN